MATTLSCAILFSGNGSNMQHLIESLHHKRFKSRQKDTAQEYEIEITLTLCNNPSAYGITRTKNLGVPCEILPHKHFATREDFDKAMINILHTHKIEYIFLAGFMRILTPAFTQKFKIINIHPSFLPEYKGAHAIKDSFYSSSSYGGVSVHWVNEELDGGEVILQEKVVKLPNDNLETFEARIHECEYSLYPRAILHALGLNEADSQDFRATDSIRTESKLADSHITESTSFSPAQSKTSTHKVSQ
ncbi:phosphoribosylglycinamide formyltransferase [Helicobacter typhlonius]|uniref:phosphoribosylglycinamide formyltransferase n=1 Tax=Helicobacter typhlonius TaxID=76936 RepID=UPI002FE23A64